ncbi:hypothetical protein HPB47_003412 [Ixodes persulcatus]|uniref:Uncharacterized protein n=1 Tax=Ixodes persulcatus TaxID=34615 RepID=A0AC60PIJ2_IXOPE|nr:hypothetical protein HPB47_003412 [Ixodes persulcatus]
MYAAALRSYGQDDPTSSERPEGLRREALSWGLAVSRLKSHRKSGVGFKNVPEKEDKPVSKEEEEKRRRFESMRKNHYKDEYSKLKKKPGSPDEEEEGEEDAEAAAASKAKPSTSGRK